MMHALSMWKCIHICRHMRHMYMQYTWFAVGLLCWSGAAVFSHDDKPSFECMRTHTRTHNRKDHPCVDVSAGRWLRTLLYRILLFVLTYVHMAAGMYARYIVCECNTYKTKEMCVQSDSRPDRSVYTGSSTDSPLQLQWQQVCLAQNETLVCLI